MKMEEKGTVDLSKEFKEFVTKHYNLLKELSK